jgi:hypothetical protein
VGDRQARIELEGRLELEDRRGVLATQIVDPSERAPRSRVLSVDFDGPLFPRTWR